MTDRDREKALADALQNMVKFYKPFDHDKVRVEQHNNCCPICIAQAALALPERSDAPPPTAAASDQDELAQEYGQDHPWTAFERWHLEFHEIGKVALPCKQPLRCLWRFTRKTGTVLTQRGTQAEFVVRLPQAREPSDRERARDIVQSFECALTAEQQDALEVQISVELAAVRASSATLTEEIPESLERKTGWMDSIDFEHEVGYALGGNKIYPDASDLRRHSTCIDKDGRCFAKRVYVVDADAWDAILASKSAMHTNGGCKRT